MIEFQNISKVYQGKNGEVQALEHVNLKIMDGEIYGIIGLSGAGKSTLLSMINGLEYPSEGAVLVNGNNICGMSFSGLQKIRRTIGMIFQEFNLLNSRTVRHNISLPLIIAGEDKAVIRERVDKLLQFVGLTDKAEQFPDQLSGGQKQRVGIARALVTNPSILLSDEATSALDPDTMESILDLLKRINKEMGITIVMVTHQIRAVQKICNKVAVMQSGKVIEEGEVFQVFSNPQQEITRDFVRTVVPDVITPSVCRQIRMESKGNYEILRLKFTGNNALGDLIYQINTKFLLKTRILHATVTELDEQTLGILILQISGSPEQIAEVEEYVRDCGVQCEEVKCQYGF
ncbi:D-methionine transport system ATP-binding protein [Succiniclasticum ruminis]|jgi:D-methionine transport system ATP-binding protein|uniref:D-methionine transport system ATP-binding protein n=1 Tax=Succiniclasticum ruminis TaxID=40841 RepID=A0A1G6KVI9_9FIRM|nr:methionine ABC transporter ATP-binding protein [Succiniclasticum ruminis]MBQ1777798.1 methionine ABC transporter ATP-binding protein [Acidaminococcaceae bacterium]MBQ2140788.1 methionine ABC transporter ATP-binding protein [Acidaminococcaceae bacterium]MBQ2221186.1 methionine ABC transporter ATP-binding protein [Acidaminococcaceae bacterium]SDC35100.1 D-methionine transport system ATP-binding protein [Succiniclasticum ruminis]